MGNHPATKNYYYIKLQINICEWDVFYFSDNRIKYFHYFFLIF